MDSDASTTTLENAAEHLRQKTETLCDLMRRESDFDRVESARRECQQALEEFQQFRKRKM